MKTKRLIAVASATALAVTVLTSCSSNGGEADEITLTFWTHTHPPMVEVMEDLIAQYEDQNPDIKIDYQTIPNADFNTKMLTDLSNGSGPDVINMDDMALRGDYIPRGLVAPIDPEALGASDSNEIAAQYVDGALEGASDDEGQLYGLPTEYNGTALAINTEHFRDAGLDPSTTPLDTWEDISSAGKQLVDAGHTQAFGFAYLSSLWYAKQYQYLLQQLGGQIADGDEGALDSPEAIEALQIWADLATGPSAVSDPNRASREATTPFQDLADGTQSMAIVQPWALQQIAETNPDTYEELQVVPLPQANPAKPAAHVDSYYLAVNNASEHQVEAWKFIGFLADHPAEFLEGVDFVQPITDWETSDAAQALPFLDVWSDAYTIGRFDQVTPHYSEVQDVIQKMVNDVVFDGVNPEDAASDASVAVTGILQG